MSAAASGQAINSLLSKWLGHPALWAAGTDLFVFILPILPEDHVQDVPFDLEVS